MFDRQTIFAGAYLHLLKQGGPAITPDLDHEEDAFCRYRLGDRACGIGGLIPDANYREQFENNPAGCDSIIRAMGYDPYDLKSGDFAFLDRLQAELHDDIAFLDIGNTQTDQVSDSVFLERLTPAAEKFAESYGLEMPPIPSSTTEEGESEVTYDDTDGGGNGPPPPPPPSPPPPSPREPGE